MKKILLSTCLLALCGCASIVSSTSENVSILTNVEDTKITIKNKDNIQIWSSEAPTTPNLEKKYGFFQGEKYFIRAEKNGFETQEKILNTNINGWYLGNLIFGGLIGLLIVDPATGAMWTLEENRVFFNLEKKE